MKSARVPSIALLLVSFISMSSSLCWAGESGETTKLMDAGDALMAQSRYADALAKYKEALALQPQDTRVLYNAGLAAYLKGDFATASKMWVTLKVLRPDDHQVRAKLVQTWQAAGQKAARDRERASLIQLHQSTEDAEFKKKPSYCLEQFEVNGTSVRAYEFFELGGEFAVRYLFQILDADGATEKSRITLGSYDMINAIAREQGALKAGERRFHLDGYFDGGKTHKTYAFFKDEPGYDDVRAIIIDIISGKRKEIAAAGK
ncbi:MAG TPA: tetratricopeptide repeat protein [Planctomycetota bacterium]|nr:tetratricopeptide repeat protein [Planctomycetota bacterium]